jgi:predicted RNA methylase
MAFNILKSLLPNRPMPMRIWRGPFRGARIVMNPRASLRKIFGLYEHELNPWLDQALQRVTRVLDVGANDGYFTFGCAAAFRRLGKSGEIIGFEPQATHVQKLRDSLAAQGHTDIRLEIIQSMVGRTVGDGLTTLDALPVMERRNTLVKIDVEGAELDVVAGAGAWLNPSNLFVIEVHEAKYLEMLKKTFAASGHKLVQINQRALPVLGMETRDVNNWWLVSDL